MTEFIPNVRVERLENYIRYIELKVGAQDLKLSLAKPEGLELFEEGMWQFARAFTEERLQYIRVFVTSGLASEEAKQNRVCHNIRMLNQIGDDEVIILSSYQSKYQSLGSEEAREFREKHRSILGPFRGEVG